MVAATTSSTGSSGGVTLLDMSNGNTAAKKTDTLDGVDFTTYITLLTKQLQNQDPTKPMDSQQFTSQIATYAQLSQQIKSNTLLQQVADSKDYTMQSVASSYLGKEVLSDGNTLSFDGSNTVDFGYLVNAAGAANGTLDIVDNSTGKIVKSSKVDTAQGLHAISWDGSLADGSKAAKGNYTVKFNLTDADGKVVSTSPQTYVKATEMVTEDGAITLKLANGDVVAFSDVKSVRTPKS